MEDTRVARDGRAYTEQEFLEFYGSSGPEMWASAYYAGNPFGNSAERPDAEEPVAFSFDDLCRLPRELGHGGKEACQAQRQLRDVCLSRSMWEIDLTSNTRAYNWKQLLKSIPVETSRDLIGAGVVEFKFRLLRTVLDRNYLQNTGDGQRHVFEICSVGGHRWHLHFHLGGKMDKLECFRPTACGASLWLGSAARPAGEQNPSWTVRSLLEPPWTLPYIMDITADSPKLTLVGRSELEMALDTVLAFYCLPWEAEDASASVGAVDITSNDVLPWARWLGSVYTQMQEDLIEDGLVKVFALREIEHTHPSIAFRHPDRTVTHVKVVNKVKYSKESSELASRLFANASVATTSWLELRGPRSRLAHLFPWSPS